MYSECGDNFVKTMLRLGKERGELNVVSDKIGLPTYAADLAISILEILQTKEFKCSNQDTQIYHYSNKGGISWYEFAKEILKLAHIKCSVQPISTAEHPTPAQRPGNT